MAVRYLAPATDFFSTTLNGAINNTQTTSITLNSVTNLQAPGVIIVDRLTSGGAANPTGRELISFTSISGSALAGTVTRGYYSTNYAHNDAAVVESTVEAGIWNSLTSQIDMAIDTNGYLKAIASPVSISVMHINTTLNLVAGMMQASGASGGTLRLQNLHLTSIASINQVHVATQLNVSSASIVGLVGSGLNPIWRVSGALSGASTLLQPAIIMPQTGNWESFTFLTRTVASGVSAIVDINKNGSSIFAAVGRPMIAAGGTFASTASIATKAFNAGDKFEVDYDGTGGQILDIVIQGRAI